MLPDKTKYKSTTTSKFRSELMALASGLKTCTLLEVGHDRGYTTMSVNHAFTSVVALDINPARHSFASQLKEQQGAAAKNVTLFLHEIDGLAEGHYDVVFIDAHHSYESVKNDWNNLLKKNTAKKYTVVFHDYGLVLAGVKKFMLETFKPEDITFMGEQTDWNQLGGPIDDWEAARITIENAV